MKDGSNINEMLLEWVLTNNYQNKKFDVKVSEDQFIVTVKK